MREKALAALDAEQKKDAAQTAAGADPAKAAASGEAEAPSVQADPADHTPDADAATAQGEAGTQPEGEEFDFAPAGPLPPSELQARIKGNAELQAILDKDPDLRNSLFASSRLAQKAAGYDSVFPGGVEEAKLALDGNKTFSSLTDLFTQVKDRLSTQAVLAEMQKLSYVLDDDGNPVMNAQGKPQSNGTVGRFIEQTFGLGLDHWASVAQQGNDDELAAAVDVLKARAFSRSASAQGELTEEQKARQQDLDRQQQTVSEERTALDAEKRKTFETKADDAYYGHMDTMLDRVLAKANLSEKDAADYREKVKAKVDETIAANPTFVAAQDAIWRRTGYGAKKLADLTALGSRWIQEILPSAAREVMKEFAGKTVASQQDRQQRLDARAQASRSEPAASMQHSAPAQMTNEQLHAKARADFRAAKGREPSVQEMLQAVRALKSPGTRTA